MYVVENVGRGDPAEFTLRVLGGPRRYSGCWSGLRTTGVTTVPWPVGDYDADPLGLDG